MQRETLCSGPGELDLNQCDFVARGGEGAIYVQGDRAFKVYNDPAHVIPATKIKELSALTQPAIVRPQEILLDGKNRPVGYTMRRVTNGSPLCQLFTRAFRERKGVTPDTVAHLVRKLRDGVQFIHERNILIVDLNEMNLLVDLTAREVLFIDVDSYQTPGFPATAIMESVRDRHTVGFTQGSDWFAFGIVSFQLFTGIHPYKGKHPDLHDLDARMRSNVSVLNPTVKTPPACYPFDAIPAAYLDWYRAVFERGERSAPPEGLQVTRPAPKAVPTPAGAGAISVTPLHRFPAEIVFPIAAVGKDYAAVTTAGLYIGEELRMPGADIQVGFAPRTGRMVAAVLDGRLLRLRDVARDRDLGSALSAEALTSCAGRLIVKQEMTLYELQLLDLPAGVQAGLQAVGNAQAHATQLFDGVAVQSLLGACHVSLFPEPAVCHCVRVPELDDYQVVNARYDNGVLMAVGARNGHYDKLILRFDPDCRSYDIRLVPDVAQTDLNFVALDSGVCLHIDANGEMELFSCRKDTQTLQRLNDPAVRGMQLFKDGSHALGARGDTLYSLSMRP